MAKAKKIKEAQLKLVNKQQTKLNSYLKNIGILESQKMNIHTSIKELSVEIDATKKELEEEYGAVNINLEDGTYTEIKEEELADV